MSIASTSQESSDGNSARLDDSAREPCAPHRGTPWPIVLFVAALSAGGSPSKAAAQQAVDVNAIVAAVDRYRSGREAEIVEDFARLLAIPNVADSLSDMERNAEHIIDLLDARGFSTRRLSAGGAPYVYGELTSESATVTLMIYAHYDGQPVIESDWARPPFEPTLLDKTIEAGGRPIDIRGLTGDLGPEWRLYARSAGDDKMPIIALLYALDALDASGIARRVNIKLLLDGEEEQGSPTVGQILDEHAGLLAADLLVFSDGPMHQSRRPQLAFGVRGDMTLDITAYGATRPLHSGHYGNWAPNPIMELAHLLTSMRDEAGHILIDGYYDDVVPLTDRERAAIAAMPDMSEALEKELAIHTPEGGSARLEELISLPAVNARGFVAGGVGDKGSNIILSSATVSLDLRLVPNQTPERVRSELEAHLIKQGFHIVYGDPSAGELRAHAKVAKLEWESGYPALRTSLDDPAARRLAEIMRSVSPELIVTPTLGGSLPLHEFGTRLAAPIVILPLANHDDNQHAENENIRLQNIWDAISIYGAIIAAY